MTWYFILLTFLFSYAQVVAGFNCSVPPIYVDIHKRIVHGTDTFQYGSFIGVGSPAQNQSLWPSLSQNETTVAGVNFCQRSNLTDCARATRGNFAFTESSTWREDVRYASFDNRSVANSSIFGSDDFYLYTHFFETDPARNTLTPNFTFEVATSGDQSPGIIGLGESSTLLQKLYNDGLIAGRTYSLYVGSGVDRAGGVINGSNTFGGYDSGRFEGPVYDYAMDTDDKNPLKVKIKDIILNDPTGLVQNVSLLSAEDFPEMRRSLEPFDARITTDQYPMSLPFQITQNFAKRLQASASGNIDGSLKLNAAFNGTMTFILDDGFEVELPADIVRNASDISPVADRSETSNEPFYLSVAWLSQVYLMLNYDEYKFHLAKAVVQQNYVMPVTFCPRTGSPVPYEPVSKNFWSLGLIGAVVGAIVGGIGVISLVVVLILVWRRKRMSKAHKEAMRASAKMEQFYKDRHVVSAGQARPKKNKGIWQWAGRGR